MINKRFLKRTSIVLVNIILGVFIVKWLWLHVDWHLLIDESVSLNQASMILSMLMGISLYLLYGFRMAVLLDINLLTSTQIVVMGFGFNAFLPFRLGDVLKIIITKQFFNIDLTKTSFATIIEKGLDLTVISCFALMFISGSTTYHAPLFFLFIGALGFHLRYESLFNRKNEFINKLITIIQPMIAKNKHKKIIFCAIGIWSVTSIVFYMFFSMNMISGVSFTFLDAIALLVFTTLSSSIPSMPASIGLFESGIVFYLTSNFHFPAEKAVAYAIIFHLIMLIPQMLFTVIIVLINTLGLKKFREISYDI